MPFLLSLLLNCRIDNIVEDIVVSGNNDAAAIGTAGDRQIVDVLLRTVVVGNRRIIIH